GAVGARPRTLRTLADRSGAARREGGASPAGVRLPPRRDGGLWRHRLFNAGQCRSMDALFLADATGRRVGPRGDVVTPAGGAEPGVVGVARTDRSLAARRRAGVRPRGGGAAAPGVTAAPPELGRAVVRPQGGVSAPTSASASAPPLRPRPARLAAA